MMDREEINTRMDNDTATTVLDVVKYAREYRVFWHIIKYIGLLDKWYDLVRSQGHSGASMAFMYDRVHRHFRNS
jgi:hypothetical protein